MQQSPAERPVPTNWSGKMMKNLREFAEKNLATHRGRQGFLGYGGDTGVMEYREERVEHHMDKFRQKYKDRFDAVNALPDGEEKERKLKYWESQARQYAEGKANKEIKNEKDQYAMAITAGILFALGALSGLASGAAFLCQFAEGQLGEKIKTNLGPDLPSIRDTLSAGGELTPAQNTRLEAAVSAARDEVPALPRARIVEEALPAEPPVFNFLGGSSGDPARPRAATTGRLPDARPDQRVSALPEAGLALGAEQRVSASPTYQNVTPPNPSAQTVSTSPAYANVQPGLPEQRVAARPAASDSAAPSQTVTAAPAAGAKPKKGIPFNPYESDDPMERMLFGIANKLGPHLAFYVTKIINTEPHWHEGLVGKIKPFTEFLKSQPRDSNDFESLEKNTKAFLKDTAEQIKSGEAALAQSEAQYAALVSEDPAPHPAMIAAQGRGLSALREQLGCYRMANEMAKETLTELQKPEVKAWVKELDAANREVKQLTKKEQPSPAVPKSAALQAAEERQRQLNAQLEAERQARKKEIEASKKKAASAPVVDEPHSNRPNPFSTRLNLRRP